MTPEATYQSKASDGRARGELTWDRIAEERPLLADTLYVAQHLQRRSPGFCANRVWYCVLKPIVLRSVGSSAKPVCRGHWQTVGELVAGTPVKHTDECRALWAEQEWLLSSAAYDLAYDRIYEALPDCQHAGICW